VHDIRIGDAGETTDDRYGGVRTRIGGAERGCGELGAGVRGKRERGEGGGARCVEFVRDLRGASAPNAAGGVGVERGWDDVGHGERERNGDSSDGAAEWDEDVEFSTRGDEFGDTEFEFWGDGVSTAAVVRFER